MYKHMLFIFIILIMNFPLRAQCSFYPDNCYSSYGYQNYNYDFCGYQDYNPHGYQECDYNSCDQNCSDKLACCYELCGMNDSYVIPFYGYSVGETVGIDENFHQFGGTVYFSQFDTMYIFQGDALAFDNQKWAASFGGGLRFCGPCECPIFGINAFYDFREGCVDRFHQFGFGFEFLNFYCLDFRANFYFPVFGRKRSDTSVFTYPGGFVATCFERESAPCATNFEVGMPIYLVCGLWNLYPAIGPYYLSFCDKSVVGVRFRGALEFRRWLYSEFIITYDSVYRTRIEGKFVLSLPFNFIRCLCHPKSQRCCFPRKLQPIDRFDAIILNKECCWTWNW